MALLVNAPNQAGWIHEIVQFLSRERGFRIAVLLIVHSEKMPSSGLSSYPHRLLNTVARLENRMLAAPYRTQLEVYDLQKSVPADTPVLCLPLEQTDTDSVVTDIQQIDILQALKLDVILTLGVPVIRGELVKVATHGLWVLAYSDLAEKGDVVHAGFWEVYQRADHTTVKLWRVGLTEEADALLDMRSFNTKAFWLKNRARALSLGNLMVLDMLRTLMRPIAHQPSVCNLQIHTVMTRPAPAQRESASYLVRQAWLASSLALRCMMKRNIRWQIGMCPIERQQMVSSNTVLLVPPKGRFFADPFVYTRQGQPFIFFEDYYFAERKGKISVATYVDGKFNFLGVVLDLPYHLSFPYIFEYGNNIYMVPETSSNRTIELWKCIEFPMKWQRHTILMEDVSAVDTIVFPYGNRWWLFTNMDRTHGENYCDELFAFYADRPDSPNFAAHALNPIVNNPIKARNAGLILAPDGKVIRCAQTQGFLHYGKGISLNRIEELTPDIYREADGPVHYPSVLHKSFAAMHHWHHADGHTVFDFAFIK